MLLRFQKIFTDIDFYDGSVDGKIMYLIINSVNNFSEYK